MTPQEEAHKREQFKVELVRALIDLDVDWARRFLCKNAAADDFIVLATLHRARMQCDYLPSQHAHLKNHSANWLLENGWPLWAKAV